MSGRDLNDKNVDMSAKQQAMADMAALAVKKQTGLLPVNKEEMDLLAGISGAFQNAIFMRYQTRITAKLYTSLMFILAPTFSYYTDTRYMPGYINPWYEPFILQCESWNLPYAMPSGCTVELSKLSMATAAAAFLFCDVFEFMTINFGILYRRTRNVHVKVDVYRQLITKEKRVVINLIAWSTVFGVFMFWAMWQSFNLTKLQRHLRTKVTDDEGEPVLGEEEILTWDRVIENCPDWDKSPFTYKLPQPWKYWGFQEIDQP